MIAAIFFMRGLEALYEPGLGLREVYVLGGFLMLIFFVSADDLGIVSWSEFGATFSEFQKGFNEGARGEE